MIEQLNAIIEGVADHPTLVSNIARVTAKLRDALMAEGFTREEAIEIAKTYKVTGS